MEVADQRICCLAAFESALINREELDSCLADLDALAPDADTECILVAEGMLTTDELDSLLASRFAFGGNRHRHGPVAPVGDGGAAAPTAVQGDSSEPSAQPRSAQSRQQRALPEVPGYEVLGRIAEGGMGMVFKARHVVLGRLVALKVPLPQFVGSGASRERFLREARAAADLRHPNICPIYEVGDANGRPFIAMAYIEGVSLSTWSKRRKPSQREAAELVATLARAVGHAHEHGVVHRDIKPANVMIDAATGEPVLTDFGLAKDMTDEMTRLTLSGQVVGTPAYMAPEQAAGRLEAVGPLADVYALGTVLYELLCGHPPFHGSVAGVLQKVQNEEPAPPRKLNPRTHRDLETICLKALAKRPVERYETAVALADDLDRFCAGEVILARRAGPHVKLWRKVRRNPALSASIVAAIVLTAVAAHAMLRVSRSRRLTAATQALEAALEEPRWTAAGLAELEAGLADVEQLSPAQAATLRTRVLDALGEHIRRGLRRSTLQGTEIEEIEGHLGLLRERAPGRADALRAALDRRLTSWEPVFDLRPPFNGLRKVFPEAMAAVEDGKLRRGQAGDEVDPDRSVPRLIRCHGNVQLEAQFDETWETASRIGLHLYATWRARGNVFLVSVPGAIRGSVERSGSQGKPPPFSALRHAGGSVRLAIYRNGVLLRSSLVSIGEIPPGPLRLRAERQRDCVVFQVNDVEPMVFRDVFPIRQDHSSFFGIIWPERVGLERLTAVRQALPMTPSPIENTDGLYAEGKFAEALLVYRRHGITSADEAVQQEARYKEALCLLALRRHDDATGVLRQLASEKGRRWPLMAKCQLWFLSIQRQKTQEADALFASIAAEYRFGELARLVPMPEHLFRTYVGAATKFGLVIYEPDRVRRAQRAVAIADLLAREHRFRSMSKWTLLLAYRAEGQRDNAIRLAEELIAKGNYYDCGELIAHYAWMLRRRDGPQRALDELTRWLGKRWSLHRPDFVALRVERARAYAALGEWENAERDVDEFLRIGDPSQLRGYTAFGDGCLLRGFLHERRGDTEAALAIWRRGVVKPVHDGQPPTTYASQVTGGTGLLRFICLASLTSELRDGDIELLFRNLDSFSGPDSIAAAPTAVLLPQSVRQSMRTMWRTPEGKGLARRLAFLDLDYPELLFAPPRLLTLEIWANGAFGGKPTDDQQALLDKLATDVWTMVMRTGEVKWQQLAVLGGAWKGLPKLLAWDLSAKPLPPKIRGPLAYAIGHRVLRKNRTKDALAYFRAAHTDAPDGSALQKLAQAEIERLGQK